MTILLNVPADGWIFRTMFRTLSGLLSGGLRRAGKTGG